MNYPLAMSSSGDPEIRVLIGREVDSVTVSGTDLTRSLLPVSEVRSFDGRRSINFQCSRFAQSNKSLNLGRLLLASVESPTGLISVAESKYRGSLYVVADTDSRSCDLVNRVSLESYLSGLLAKEMNASWHIEALKAQAVAARTYALFKVKSREESLIRGSEAYYDVENSERNQVSGTFLDSTPRTDQAVRQTRGEILVTRDGKLLTPTFFHASCGGRTREPHKVWANEVPGYSEVDCEYCERRRTHSRHRWSKELDLDRMITFFRWAFENDHIKGLDSFSEDVIIRVVPSAAHIPEIRVYFGQNLGIIHKNTFRRYFGRVAFPSTYFSIQFSDGLWTVSGQGNGHGVGLCQVGAYDLAKQGWDYRRILAHYYPGHMIKSLY